MQPIKKREKRKNYFIVKHKKKIPVALAVGPRTTP